MANGQGHDGDGDGGTLHIDSGTQRDADGIKVGGEAQTLAERHIHGDVGGRTAGEKGAHSTVLEADAYQGEGIGAQIRAHQYGIDHKGREEHANHEQAEQAAVGGEYFEAALGHRGEHNTHNAERRKLDNPSNDGADDLGQVADHADGSFACLHLEAQPHNDGPEENADVVGLGQAAHRIVRQFVHHIAQNIR